MSLIIAIKDKNRIVLGADKQVSTGSNKDHTCTKIWDLKELPGAIMGGVGSARGNQVIQYSQIIDKNAIDDSTELDTAFVVNYFLPSLVNSLKQAGLPCDMPEREGMLVLPNAFLFAYKSRAWMIWHDLSVMELTDYFAIGSGSDVATGVLFATKDRNPFERIITCIDAAAESTLYVDNGVDLLSTEVLEDDYKQIHDALEYSDNTQSVVDKPKKQEKQKQKKTAASKKKGE